MYNAESGAPAPSFFQIAKNYETAVKKKGGKKIYYSKDAGVATFFLPDGAKEEWIVVTDLSGIMEGSYELSSLEIDPMKQEVTINSLYDKLSTNGFVTLYINFENGKAEIKNESNKLIGKIAEMLLTDTDLNISIEGHTDDSGSPAKNQSLSEDRAKAVLEALAARGIDRNRMKARGWGQTKPVAGNDSEEGRAMNRRVVIKKL
jgi:outer membrane protein OmpA-like peptidoglycan-associated protein